MKNLRLALTWAALLVAAPLPRDARAEAAPTVTTLPVARGVAAEAHLVIAAPAERVAAVAGDPRSFGELLPAAVVRPLGRRGDADIVEVERHEPWPIGVVRWTESVRRRQAPGGALLIERQAIDDGYFRRLEATFTIAPLPGGRSDVSYRVSMDLRRWAPAWMVRRGNSAGIVGTLGRLQRMCERPAERASAAPPSRDSAAGGEPPRPLAAARPAP